jgi:hypothetical protein
MPLIKKWWLFFTAVLFLTTLAMLGLFRHEITAGCTGSPCNEFRNFQWESILGAILGILAAFSVAKYSINKDRLLRAEERSRPALERIEIVQKDLCNALSHFDHVRKNLLAITEKLNIASEKGQLARFDAFAATNTVDAVQVESSLHEAEDTLQEIVEVYGDNLAPQDKRSVRNLISVLNYHRNVITDFEKLLGMAPPRGFTEVNWQAHTARNIEDKCMRLPKRLNQAQKDLQLITNGLRGRR